MTEIWQFQKKSTTRLNNHPTNKVTYRSSMSELKIHGYYYMQVGGGDGQTLNLVGGAYFSFGWWGDRHIGVIVEKTWLRTDIQYGIII